MDKTPEADASTEPPAPAAVDLRFDCITNVNGQVFLHRLGADIAAEGVVCPSLDVAYALQDVLAGRRSADPAAEVPAPPPPKSKRATITDLARELIDAVTAKDVGTGAQRAALGFAALAVEALDRIGTQLGHIAESSEGMANSLDRADRMGWGQES